MILSVLSSPALVSSLMVVRAKNPVHSVLFPIPVFRDTSSLLILGLIFNPTPVNDAMGEVFILSFFHQCAQSRLVHAQFQWTNQPSIRP